MRMTRKELDTMLNTLGCQVFYNHTTQKDVVNFPYIVYLDEGTDNFEADNYTYKEIMEYLIVVHTIDRDNEVIDNLKDLFIENRIPYEVNAVDWNEDIMAYAVSFIIYLWKNIIIFQLLNFTQH